MKKMCLTALVGLAARRSRSRVVGGRAAGSTAPTAPKADVTAALVSDIGKFNDRGFNQNQLAGLNKAKTKLGVNDDRAAVELGQRLHPEHDLGRPPARRTSSSRPASCSPTRRRRWRRSSRTRTSRSPTTRSHAAPFADKKGKPLLQERRGPDLRGERGRLPRRRARGEDGPEDGQEDHRRRRRPEDPAGRHLDRGLQVLRAEGRAGHEGARRLLAGLRRDRQVQDRRPEPDRPGRAGALPGRGRLRPRHAEGGRRGRQVWGIGVDVDQYDARASAS